MNSEERFEHIEHKIIEAAKNTQVGFEEESWVKMEALLNKDDKRKRFVWWWFLLIPITFAGYGIYKSLDKNNTAKANIAEKSSPINNTQAANIIPAENNNITSTTITESATKKNVAANPTATPIISKINEKNIDATARNSNTNNTTNTKTLNSNSSKTVVKKLIAANVDFKDSEEINAKKKNRHNQKSATGISIKNAITETNEITATTKVDSIKKNSEAKNEIDKQKTFPLKDSNNNVVTTKVKPIKKKTILSRFYLLAAGGLDNGSVKLLSFNNSKFVPKYGVSIGYDITKKISVQAGIYFSDKKYTAGPTDYTAKTGSIVSRLYITKADAECKIFEIPIALRYNFLQKSRWGFYATAGVSSYIMKEEFYNIFYLRNNNEYSRPYTYTGNQHLFSTALISVGVEKKLSNHFALQLEPIISIPLKTIGEGSVKLFSTSLQLGVKYHLFKK
jgi:hypothetical protein